MFFMRNLKVKNKQIGYIFGGSRPKSQKRNIKFLCGEGKDGSHTILTPEELQIIEEEIKKQYKNSFYPTANEITQLIIKKFNKNWYTNTACHILIQRQI